MLEYLIDLDKKIFLALNHFAGPVADPVMRFLSGPVPWIIFFVVLLGLLWSLTGKNKLRQFGILVVGLILAYATTEQTSVHLFKEVFLRFRPCHEPSLTGQVRLVVEGCGGQYGFVSTHAANSFNLALLASLLVHRKWFSISVFCWAALVSYSRIYVGVHYPGDVLGGMALGFLTAFIVFFAIEKSLKWGVPESRKMGRIKESKD